MAYKTSFMDNETYGVDDFNAILGDIAQGGVVSEDFDNTSVYQMSKMNVVTKNLISQGVCAKETSLAPSLTAEGVDIAPGMGIFSNGAKIKVTQTESVKSDDIENFCVWAYFDAKYNLSGFGAGESFPDEVDGEMYILPICSVENGLLCDKRLYAKAKIRVCDSFNTVKKHFFTVPRKEADDTQYVLDLGGDKVNFLCFVPTVGNVSISVVEETEDGEFVIYYDNKTRNNVLLYNLGAYTVLLENFRRNETGSIVCDIKSNLVSGNYSYTMYSSVCVEEG